jgi:rhodanese-related sulfurtransferase
MNKKVKIKKKVKGQIKASIKTIIFDVVIKAIIITTAAVLIGLAYTGARKTLFSEIKEVSTPVTETAVVETPVPTNTPVTIKKPVIAARYRHLLNPAKTKEELPRIQIEEAKALYESGKALFVDARGAQEYDEAHIKGAVSIPAGSPPEKIKELVGTLKNKVLVSYCHGVGCHLADKTAFALYDAGYHKVIIFFGGWPEWTQAGMPVDKYEPPAEYKPLFEDALSADSIKEISLDEAKFLYDKNLGNFIDVDFQDNYNQTHLDRAISLPLDKLEQLLPSYGDLFKQKPSIIYCHGIGKKTRAAAEKIYAAGNKKLLLFIQALPQWKKAGYPLYKAPDQVK